MSHILQIKYFRQIFRNGALIYIFRALLSRELSMSIKSNCSENGSTNNYDTLKKCEAKEILELKLPAIFAFAGYTDTCTEGIVQSYFSTTVYVYEK